MTRVRVDINQVEELQIRFAATGLGPLRQRLEGAVGAVCCNDRSHMYA